MIQKIKRTVTGSKRSDVVYECRRCGQTLSSENETCPSCNGTDVSRYEL